MKEPTLVVSILSEGALLASELRAHTCEIINSIFAMSGHTLLQTLKSRDVLLFVFVCAGGGVGMING